MTRLPIRKSTFWALFCTLEVSFLGTVCIILLINDPTFFARFPTLRIPVSGALIALGYWYYRLRKVSPKVVLGIFAITTGILSNWLELGKISSTAGEKSERVLFLLGGIAIIAHGFKQLSDARENKEVDD